MLHIITCNDQYDAGKMLLHRMVQDSVRNPAGSYIALVPEQATLRMQQAVIAAHPQHAVMNIDVVSFERLAHSVFQELGVLSRAVLNDTGKILVLRKVLQELKGSLQIYRGKTRMPGFAEQIKSAISEFKQYSLDDNQLFLMQESAQREGNKILYEKLQDIRLIYRRFNETIADKYTTQEEVPDALARLASRSKIVTGSCFYLDGFTGFTPVQFRLIREFLRLRLEVTVTVIIPQGAVEEKGMDMFSLSRTTLRKLQDLAEKQNVPCEILYMSGGAEGEDHPCPLPRVLCFSEADKDREIRRIASQILSGVQSKDRRFRDYGVVLADMETYHKTVEEVFAQAKIPCFIDHKKKLSDNLLARFLGAALQVVQERFSYDSVFSVLKTRMSSLTPRQIYELENYCLAFGIREHSVWKKDFTKNKVRKGAISGERTGEQWDLESINASRRAVADLLSGFYEACTKKDCTAADYTAALKNLLDRSGIQSRIEEYAAGFKDSGDVSRGKEYEQVYQQIITLLEQIEDLMGNEVLSVWEFREILMGASAQIQVSIIPPSLDAVPVGDLVRSRMGQPEILFLAGANDGTIPQKTAGAGLFTAQERTFLKQEKFELAPDGLEDLYTQQFYLYLLFTRAKKSLFVSWARMSPEGEELRPSYIIEHMEEIVPGLSAQQEPEDPSGLWLEQGKQELTRAISRYCSEKREEEELRMSRQEQALLHYTAQKHRPWLEQILSAAFFTNRVLPLDEQIVQKLYGRELAGSVSRYERFYECPFRHFLDYGLQLKEREEFQVQSRELGTVYHESLERYANKLKTEGLTFRTVSDEDSDRIAQEAVSEAASEMTGDILRSSERNRYLLGRMVQITRKTADVLRDQVQQGAYDPEYFELAFEEQSSGDAALRGKIDRVDLYEDKDIFVKIIDYKSGQKAFSVKDIYSGLQLQLTAYLSAAVRKLEQDYPGRTIRPGGIYYYLIQDRFLKSSEDVQEKYCMSGLTNSDPQAVHAIDRNLGPGQASSIVPVEYGKTGALSHHSVVASDEEFWHLMGFVQGRIREAVQQIRQGEASIRPYCADAEKTACRYCSYRNVCKFEPGKWGSDERTLPEGQDKKDLENEIYGRH